MSQKELEIRIKPDGELSIETFGTEGQECSKLVEQVVAYVGGDVAEANKKPEFWNDGRHVYTNV